MTENNEGGKPGTLSHVMRGTVDVTAIIIQSVTSQLECAHFCGSDRSVERRLYRWRRQQRKLPHYTGS